MGNGDDISRAHLLGLIGQRGHPAIDFRKLGIARLVPQVPQRHAQRIAPGVLSENQRARGTPTVCGEIISYVSGFLMIPSW